MNILVINGSPKGKNSVTLQTCNYLQILHPEHQFDVLHVGATVKSLEKDFSPALAAIEKAEVLLFSYPVYTFVAPCQLHRFIELLKEANLDLSGKYATQLSTSKHFYDITAHRYIQDNCQDLGLRYIPGLSADMDDLTTKKGQQEAEKFFDFLCWSVGQGVSETAPAPLPAPACCPVTVPEEAEGEKTGDVVIVADFGPEDTQVPAMINRFRAKFPGRPGSLTSGNIPSRVAAWAAFTVPLPESVSTKTALTNSSGIRSRPPSPSSTPSPSGITPWVPGLRCTMTGISATVTALSPSACRWAT